MSAQITKANPSSVDHVGDRQARHSRAAFWALALLTSGTTFALFYWPFIEGTDYHYHDSSVPATQIGLFYDRLYGSDSWLWSASLNGGQPLWVSLETMPFFDPVAFVVYSLAVAFKAEWWVPYHLTAAVWMFALSLGGGLCTYQLTRSRAAALLTFLLLFAGPLAHAIPSQSNGFLVPFRYFPLAIYFYLRLRQSVTPAILLSFTTTIAFGLAGYQSAYVLALFLGLGLSELLIGGQMYLAWLRQLLRPRHAAFFLIPLAAVTPLVLWLAYLQDIVSISRNYRHGHVYIVELTRFAADLLYAYLNVIRFDRSISIWHGSTFVGILVLPFLLLGFRRSALAALATLRGDGEPTGHSAPFAAFWLWLLITAALTTGLFGLTEYLKTEGDVAGLRNFGYLLTACLFLLAVIAGYGLSEVTAGRYGLKDVLSDTVFFALLVASSVWLVAGHREGALAVAAQVATFALVGLLWYRLAKGVGVTRAALVPVVVVFLELVSYTYGKQPTLTVLTTDVGRPEAANLARTRTPKLGQPPERLPATRKFEYSGEDYWPYHFEGPAVFKDAFSYSEPYHSTPLDMLGFKGLTHFFRVEAYDRLLRRQENPETLKAVLGVTRPILELVPLSAFVDHESGGLALVLRNDGQAIVQPDRSSGIGEVRVLEFSGDRLVVEVSAWDQAVLVYRDNMAPGWSVTLDGEDAELVVVDRVNKALAVPPGQHRVEFVYRPRPYLAAFSLRAVVLLAALAACAWLALRSARKPQAP